MHIFCLLWFNAFTNAMSQFFCCCSFSKWYYYQDGTNDLPAPPGWIMQSLYRCLLHTGTVVFGSLLVAICNAIRLCLSILTKKARASKADDNFVIKVCLYIVNILAWLLEKFVEMITK